MPQYESSFRGHLTKHYVEGAGPPLMLIHGIGPGTSIPANFTPVMRALSSQRTCVGFDLIGFGGSAEKPDGDPFDIPLWVDQAAAVLDSLDGPVTILGHSIGGAIALTLAARHSKVAAVVTTGCGGGRQTVTPQLDQFWSYPRTEADLAKALRGTFHDHGLITPEVLGSRMETLSRGTAGAYFERMMQGGKQQLLDRAQLSEAILRTIEQPVLFIHGKFDELSPAEDTSIPMSALVKSADLAVLGACGHNPLRERLDTSLTLIQEFLARTSSLKS